ncbi:MAG: hypothetical protein QM736_15665 [Vicinamibacterales bacterium]
MPDGPIVRSISSPSACFTTGRSDSNTAARLPAAYTDTRSAGDDCAAVVDSDMPIPALMVSIATTRRI